MLVSCAVVATYGGRSPCLHIEPKKECHLLQCTSCQTYDSRNANMFASRPTRQMRISEV